MRNSTCVHLIEYCDEVDGFRVTVSSSESDSKSESDRQSEGEVLYARKVVLATGIQVCLCIWCCVMLRFYSAAAGQGGFEGCDS